eukprot:IDg733t1
MFVRNCFAAEPGIIGHLPAAATYAIPHNSRPSYRGRKAGALQGDFRIQLKLYWRLHDEVVTYEVEFLQKKDALGKAGNSSHRKSCAACDVLSNGLSFVQLDDMSQMSPESQSYYFQRFLAVGQ